jgi:hypothetical protein
VNVEAVWMTQQGQHWELVLRLKGGEKVRIRCESRLEARTRLLQLLQRASELTRALKMWLPANGAVLEVEVV